MASTPPHCSIAAVIPYQTHQYPLNHRLISHQHVSLPNPSSFSPLCSLRPPKLDPLSRRRPTRSHSGRPKATVGPSRHSPPAEEALQSALQLGKDESSLDTVLLSFESKLCGSDDYMYLLRELGNRGECWKAVQCFEFAVRRENSTTELEKLAATMVTTLAILGKFDLAKNVFQTAVNEGYGKTVNTYSALVSAYARSGNCDEAMDVFAEMKKAGLKADVALYSELIDALCKNGMVEAAVTLLEEMAKEGIQPDVVAYNSMIDAIGRSATTEAAVDNGASISEKDGEASQEKVQNQVEDREGKFQGNSKLDKQHDLLYPLLFREYIYALAHDRDASYGSRFSLLIVKRLIRRMSSMY